MKKKCGYFTCPDNCTHLNDPDSPGECVYENGIIHDKAAMHCSEGLKFMEEIKLDIKNMSDEEKDEYIDKCLTEIGKKFNDRVFSDYCAFEDAVGDVIENEYPNVVKILDEITIGRIMVVGQMRNQIRSRSTLKIKVRNGDTI